jgi:hypothetical protein
LAIPRHILKRTAVCILGIGFETACDTK